MAVLVAEDDEDASAAMLTVEYARNDLERGRTAKKKLLDSLLIYDTISRSFVRSLTTPRHTRLRASISARGVKNNGFGGGRSPT